MSYSVSLYESEFLRAAIRAGSGNWLAAPLLNADVCTTAARLVEANGFVPTPHPPGFLAYLRAEGVTPSTQFLLATSLHRATLDIFASSIVFSVEASPIDTAAASIELVRRLGRQLAMELRLGFHDPQQGEVICTPV
jgi:hypothetical protein